MKRTEFNKADYSRTTVICKSDGPIVYCNALAVDGTCKCADCNCRNAIAVIAEKDCDIEVREYPSGDLKVSTITQKHYLALED